MLQYRDAAHEDFKIIAGFPQNPEELFYMFPKGTFPVTPEQLEQVAASRFSPTVVTESGEVVGYCNLYNVTAGGDCWVGNLIVHPARRGSGVATFLLQAIGERARTEYGCREIRLVCHNTNTRALLLYSHLGFKPFDIQVGEDPHGNRIARILMSKPL